MDQESLSREPRAPIIALPQKTPREQVERLQLKYGDRYRIISIGSSLAGKLAHRILILMEVPNEPVESVRTHDWIDYHLACRLLPNGKMIEIAWDPQQPGKVSFSPMRRKTRK